MYTRKIVTKIIGSIHPDDYVGSNGDMWIDDSTNSLHIYNGSPGGFVASLNFLPASQVVKADVTTTPVTDDVTDDSEPTPSLVSPHSTGDYKFSEQPANHSGWLLCDGSAVNRRDHPELFALLGDRHGKKTTRTFSLPPAGTGPGNLFVYSGR